MPFVVSKFGGTSLCSGEMFLRVRDIVKENPNRRIVVVSAPGKRDRSDTKVTDLLLLLSENRSRRLFNVLEDRLLSIADTLQTDIGNEIEKIRKAVFSLADEAEIVSRGEWLSGIIMSRLLSFHFLDAADAILFSGSETDGKTYEKIRNAFSEHGGLVIPGFYGRDEKGRIRLFPRGGSDITGAIAAKAIGAELYENWTDVNGVYDKNPAEYRDAKKISKMTFSEMKRLADEGACVLHPDSLAPVREAGIPVRVKNTFNPGETGTLIHP